MNDRDRRSAAEVMANAARVVKAAVNIVRAAIAGGLHGAAEAGRPCGRESPIIECTKVPLPRPKNGAHWTKRPTFAQLGYVAPPVAYNEFRTLDERREGMDEKGATGGARRTASPSPWQGAQPSDERTPGVPKGSSAKRTSWRNAGRRLARVRG